MHILYIYSMILYIIITCMCVPSRTSFRIVRGRMNRERVFCVSKVSGAHHIWAFFDKPSRTVVNTHQEMANRNKRQCRALIRRLQGTLMRLYCADRHLFVESRSFFPYCTTITTIASTTDASTTAAAAP